MREETMKHVYTRDSMYVPSDDAPGVIVAADTSSSSAASSLSVVRLLRQSRSEPSTLKQQQIPRQPLQKQSVAPSTTGLYVDTSREMVIESATSSSTSLFDQHQEDDHDFRRVSPSPQQNETAGGYPYSTNGKPPPMPPALLSSSTRNLSQGSGGNSSAATPSSSDPRFRNSSPSSRLRRKTALINNDTLSDSTVAQRLVEYFCIITCKPTTVVGKTPKASNYNKNKTTPRAAAGAVAAAVTSSASNSSSLRQESSSTFLPDEAVTTETTTPSAQTNKMRSGHLKASDSFTRGGGGSIVFVPKITARYPVRDYPDNPLNPMILSFCFPTGADEIMPTTVYQLPRVHYFVLTNEKGRKVYGTCLTIWEEHEPIEGEVLPENDSADVDHVSCPSGERIEVRMITIGDNKKPPKKLYFLPKVLCITSTWPYLTAFREYLAQLYRLATATNVMTAPIERYIVNLCKEIPAPPPGVYEIQVKILDSTIRFWAPPANLPIPYVALPYSVLFECLDLDHLLELFCALLMEQKIVLLSSQYSILTICSEIMCSLLFPMRWSHLYIPVLPKMLCPMLDAPVPYICGVVRDNWMFAKDHVASDAIVVDLDLNQFTLGQDTQTIPSPPVKKWSKLHSTLQQALGDIFERAHGHDLSKTNPNARGIGAHGLLRKSLLRPNMTPIQKLRETKDGTVWQEKLESWDHAFNLAFTPDSELMDDLNAGAIEHCGADGQTQWDKVQEAFLRFFVALFKDYRTYLTIPSPASDSNRRHRPRGGAPSSPRPSFNDVGFLEAQPPANRPFVQAICKTQQFDDFITRRMYSPGEPELQFFDQSIDAKMNRSRLKLKKVDTPVVQNAKAHKILKTLNAIEPDESGLTDFNFDRLLNPYIYETWPETFNPKLFSRPRPLPKMITAEFDRQALSVSQLRIADAMEFDEDEIEFFAPDYDPSPEVGAFTVYFFTYTAMVGLEWQHYQEKALQEAQLQHALCEEPGASFNKECRDVPYNEAVEAIITNSGSCNPAFYPCDDQCISDLTMGFCNNADGVKEFQSTLVFVNKGAEDAYNAFFKDATERMKEIQRTLSGDGSGRPETVEAVVEYEEARLVATAQLDLAFETLKTLSLRGLSADLDAYKSLMEACGRCGEAQRAQGLIELMQKDGFVLDGEILSWFVAAFAHEEDAGVDDLGSPADEKMTIDMPPLPPVRRGDAYSNSIQKSLEKLEQKQQFREDIARPWLNFEKLGRKRSDSSADGDDTASIKSAETDASYASSIVFGWLSGGDPRNRLEMARRRRRRRKLRMSRDKKVTPMLATQLDLGQALLDCIYPDLQIDTNKQSCPHCSYTLSEDEVIQGWTPCSFDDFTTKCCKCAHPFVPHFSVATSEPSFKGSQGAGTALFCEFLSPWVLRKALHRVVKGDVGIEGMLAPEWRNGTDIRATLFWNLMVMCRRYNLPFTFLLQGSVEGRLILPRPPTDM